jgi:hypothetical protein
MRAGLFRSLTSTIEVAAFDQARCNVIFTLGGKVG